MTTATAALDPGETIAAAMRELYDQLREILDRGPTDDPGLLDEIGRLTGRIRRRITGARKKAEPAEEPTAKPGSAPEPTRQVAPTAAGTAGQARPQTVGATPATARARDPRSDAGATADVATVPRHRAVPAPRREEYTVRLPRPSTGGRHRAAPTRLPLWVYALVILLTVAGVTLGTAVSPSAFAALPATAVLLGAAVRLNARRRVPTLGGVR